MLYPKNMNYVPLSSTNEIDVYLLFAKLKHLYQDILKQWIMMELLLLDIDSWRFSSSSIFLKMVLNICRHFLFLYFKMKKKTYLERFWGCLFFNRVEVGGMLKTNIYVNKSFPSLWHITTLLLGYEFFKAANSSSALEVKLAYWPFV